MCILLFFSFDFEINCIFEIIFLIVSIFITKILISPIMADITFSNLQNAIFMVITSICIVGYFGKFYYCFWYNISEIKWMYTFYQKNEKNAIFRMLQISRKSYVLY